MQYEQQKLPHLGQAGAQRESWGDTGALHDPPWGFGCSPSGWHHGGAPNPKLGRGKGTDFSLFEKCPRVSSPTGYCYTRNRAPQRLHSFFFPFFFPLPTEHCYTRRAAPEPLFNVTCAAKVPQAPAAAAWDICTYPSQWKEEGVGGRIRLLTPLLFLGQKKASSWLKNHGAEKVFQPERVRWSHWGFFFCLSPSPASPFGQAAGSHRVVLHSQNTCCTSRSPSPRRRGKALEPKQTKINHFSLQI